MPVTKAHIDALIKESRYDLEILPELEAYVEHQAATNAYDLEANLACLKLYQFHADRCNLTITAKILVKALMVLPANDYTLCMYLIPDKVQQEEIIAVVRQLARQLETCQLKKVWEQASAYDQALQLDKIVGCYDSIRNFVVQLVSFTYQSITKDEFCSLTNLDAAKADALAKVQVHCHALVDRQNHRHHGLAHRARCYDVQSQGWNVTATSYEIPVNAENQAKSRNISENISIDHIARILPTMSV